LERADVLAEVAVPDTIQGVLMARIDRLPPKFRPKFRGFKTRLICVKGRPTLALPADESPAIAL
jgi:hypothetical protein